MSRRSPLFLVLVTLFLVSFSAHAAQVDYFLKIDGIEGESTDANHRGWIEIESFSWGAAQPAARATGTGKCSLQDFHFVMRSNKASPLLRSAQGSRRTFPQAVVEVRGERHLLQNLVVTGITPHPGGDVPMEQVSFNFARCQTHGGAPGPAAHKHKGEGLLKAPGNPVAIALLLPAVQKVREAAQPAGPLNEILIGLSIGPGSASIIVQGGSEAASLLQRAFQNQQRLDFLEISRRDQPHMKIKLNDVLISSYQVGGAPTEQLSLNYPKVELNRAVRLQLRYATMEGSPAAFQDVAASWPDGYLK